MDHQLICRPPQKSTLLQFYDLVWHPDTRSTDWLLRNGPPGKPRLLCLNRRKGG